MTVVALLKALKGLVEEAIEDVQVEPGYVRPNVYLGYPPFKTIPNDAGPPGIVTEPPEGDDIPYVLIRAVTGEDEQYEMDTAKVKIYVETRDITEQGYLDVLHIFENIRYMIAYRNWIGGKFQIVGKSKWTLPEEQPWPIWQGMIETTWSIPGVEKEDLLNV